MTMYPCNECAKLLIQAGITEVIYAEVSTQMWLSFAPRCSATFFTGACAGEDWHKACCDLSSIPPSRQLIIAV